MQEARAAAHWAVDQVMNAAESDDPALRSAAQSIISAIKSIAGAAESLSRAMGVEPPETLPDQSFFEEHLHELRIEVIVRGGVPRDQKIGVKTLIDSRVHHPEDAIEYSLGKMISAVMPHVKGVLDGKEE
ncbi:hypothetical protein PBI_NINA_64 [Gordonia phage Nina]|uniref:Uncharacterized protein n=2 Tax=Emalynvirus cozz TaxID=2560490 RepID=A0A7M1CLM4_9CAUD|nr:hypothetical protein PBI_NINA_64 [Gordonia phage Nina]QOP65322.1 hypothetical protein SEA_BURNSEY_64 [Gordonia phage Burnsey]